MKLELRNFEVWLMFLLLNVSSALEGSLLHFDLTKHIVEGNERLIQKNNSLFCTINDLINVYF